MRRRNQFLDAGPMSRWQRGIKFTYPAWKFTDDDGSPELELA
jgi:hypothetical protein